MNTTTKTTTETGELDEGAYPVVDHSYLKDCVEEFIVATENARALSERCRDYKDGRQWTPEQIRILKRRGQAPVVNNRVKVKHNGLLGLTAARKSDPKAFPRNVNTDGDAADAATDALRFVSDKTRLNSTFLECADNFFCEGYTGVHVIADQTPDGKPEVVIDQIPWDRLFFDAHSSKHDFSDARGKGFVVWMDKEDIAETFPDTYMMATQTKEDTFTTTFDDRPSWYMRSKKRERFLVATHYFKHKGAWNIAIYTLSGFLLEPMKSPYVDEFGSSICPLIMEHAYINRDNERYGELASFLDLQDEINHRRSKALHLLSQRQTYGNRGAVKDVKKIKQELAKPDGHMEVNVGEFGKDFGVLPTGDMAAGQVQLLMEAKQEMDAQSYNAQMAGERSKGDLSGVAIQRLQQNGITELIMLFENFSSFKLRVFSAIWQRIRQFWNEETWVRVTDDQQKMRWVGFNVEVTLKDALQEVMDDDSKPHAMRVGAVAQMMQLEQTNPQALEQVVMVKNRPAELDMDIILDESYDTVNISQEQLDTILKFGAQGEFDLIDLLEISNVSGKDKLIKKIEERRANAAQSAQQDPKLQLDAAKAADTMAAADLKQKTAQKTEAETVMLINQPQLPLKGSVVI